MIWSQIVYSTPRLT